MLSYCRPARRKKPNLSHRTTRLFIYPYSMPGLAVNSLIRRACQPTPAKVGEVLFPHEKDGGTLQPAIVITHR